MKYTIKDLSEGRCAVINNGTRDEIKKVMRLAFPQSYITIYGDAAMYYRDGSKYSEWDCSSTNLPKQSVKDFLEEEWEPKWGEEVEVVDTNENSWVRRIFLAKKVNTHVEAPYIAESVVGSISCYKYIRKPQPRLILSMKDIAEKFGVPVDSIEIKMTN